MNEEGEFKGEICNRNGCAGIIDEYDTDDSCSCHINPPCSYCTTSREYCPECGWDGRDEQLQSDKGLSDEQRKWYNEQQARIDAKRKMLEAQIRGEIPVTDFDYMALGYTHSSMEIRGVYPDGMTQQQIREKLNCRVGQDGRFTAFGNNKFVFIAYTD